VRAVWGGLPVQQPPEETFAALDRFVRPGLSRAGAGPVFAVTLLRQARYGRALADVGAVDGLARWVTLTSGRVPRVCRQDRCEVVQVGGTGPLPEPTADIRFVRVGRGLLRSALPLGRLAAGPTEVVRQAERYHAPKRPPLLLADGARALASIGSLDFSYRTYSWVSPLRGGDVSPWGVDAFARRVERAEASLAARSDVLQVTAPLDELRAARATSRAGARRLLLLGGQAAVLLLAFALLAASSLAADADASDRRLTWLGAPAWQRRLTAGVEAAVLALAATVLGWVVGSAVSLAVARAAGSEAGAVLSHSLVSPRGLLVAVALASLAALALLAAARLRPARIGRLSITPLDVAAVGAAAAVAIGLTRGRADAETLAADSGTGVLLLLLPGLVTFVAAVVCIRLLAPLLRAGERASRGRSVPFRLAALSLARNPGRAAAASAFLLASVSACVFAGAYRATLRTNEADQAAFAVPLDYTLEEDFTELVTPLGAAPLARYEALPGVRGAYPVVRLFGDAAGRQGSSAVTVLGVPTDALTRVRRWRGDFASLGQTPLAAALRPATSVALRGIRLPADARALSLPASIVGTGLGLTAAVETTRGEFVPLELGVLARNSSSTLRAAVPPAARGGLLTALSLNLPTAGMRGHGSVGAIGALEETSGTLRVGRPTVTTAAGRRPLGRLDGWTGVNGATRTGQAIDYHVTAELPSRLRPRQPTDGLAVPVVASRALARAAGDGGLLPVTLGDQQVLTRVVASAGRLPTLEGDFVVADEAWLASALNTDYPGTGVPSEIWVDGSPAAARPLAAPPFDRLELRSRRALEDDLRSDPMAHGATLLLAAAAAIALALALLGALLAVLADLRDDRRELLDLESQGAAPSTLRRHLRLRAGLTAVIGVAGGLVAGAVLVALVVDVVVLTSGGRRPEPPLVLRLDLPVLAAGLVAYLVAAAALVALATGAAFRREAAA
jgi:hypothetical protein